MSKPASVYGEFYAFKDKSVYQKAKNPLMVNAMKNTDGTWNVMISDLHKDWQNPYSGTHDIGNPKLKLGITEEEFNRVFEPITI